MQTTQLTPYGPETAAMAGRAVALLLDLENLLHEARRIGDAAVREGFEQVMARLLLMGDRRYAVGACDRWLARALCPAAAEHGVRVYPGPIGKDRADKELLTRGSTELPACVDVLVIGSGDGAFTDLALRQRAAGRRVIVAGRDGHISRALATAADEVLLLELDASIALAA